MKIRTWHMLWEHSYQFIEMQRNEGLFLDGKSRGMDPEGGGIISAGVI